MPSPLLHAASRGAGFLGESWHAWTALAIGVVSISAQTASSMTFSVLMKPMLADFGWTRTDFTGAMTLRMTVMVLLIAYAGLLTDRIGARFVLAAGALIIGVGSLAVARIDSLPAALRGDGLARSRPGGDQYRRRLRARGAAVRAAPQPRRRHPQRRRQPAEQRRLLPRRRVARGVGLAADHRDAGSIYLLLAVLILWALRRGSGEAATAAAEPARREVRLRDVPWGDRRLWVLCLSYALIYAFITSVQLHLHAFLTDLGHSPLDAAQILSILTLVGAVGAPLFGFVAERTNARAALIIVVAGLASTSVVLWTARGLGAFTVWAVIYGLVNSGVVALLALILDELFGAAQIGRLMGVAMVFCMTATMIGNNFSAAVFDRTGSYHIAWQSYTALMVLTLVPVVWLGRQATRPTNAIAAPSGSVGA